MKRVKHIFPHGLGDCVQFTAVLKHLGKYRPEWDNYIQVSDQGKANVFGKKAFWRDSKEKFDLKFMHSWAECMKSYSGIPSTKTTQCLKNVFGIEPCWNLLNYTIEVTNQTIRKAENYYRTLPKKRGIVIIHYQGNTSQSKKNLSHEVVKEVCDWLIYHEFNPVILDWDSRSPIPDSKTIFCPDKNNSIWGGLGTGDAEIICALMMLANACVCVDSGPQKIAATTPTPLVGIFAQHSPCHYMDNCPNTFYLVPENHTDYIRGDKLKGLEFFAQNYKYETYKNPANSIKKQLAVILDISFNPMTEPGILRSKVYNEKYYLEHKETGLDYLDFSDWQIGYGKWIVESLELKDKTLLDLGAACGSIANGLAQAGALVSACDINEYMVTEGRKKWLTDTFKIADAVNLHYWEDNTFDCVQSMDVFEHFKPKLVPFILEEIHRVTKLNGILFVVLDTIELYERQKRDISKEDPTHLCVKPMDWWHQHLANTGWKHDNELLEKLKSHPLSYFKQYDWPVFLVRKI